MAVGWSALGLGFWLSLLFGCIVGGLVGGARSGLGR
jgi:hypothetical protein